MDNILWLPSWYPNRTDIYQGDFIERHALAVSAYTRLTVLVVIKDKNLPHKKTETEKITSGNLTVYRVYYGSSGLGGVIEKLYSSLKYYHLQKKIFGQVFTEVSMPRLVHVHVAMKAGMMALWLKKKYNIPFLVTEHWSGYNPVSQDNIYKANFIYRWLNKKILKEATLLLPVSDALGKMINLYFVAQDYRVVPNVVNTALFFYQPYPKATVKRFRFIHSSFMNFPKNPEGILLACKIVKEQGYDFELLMLGNMPADLLLIAKQYGLSESVIFEAAVPYAEVARKMQSADALLLFSRYENLPCVMLEALCCGLPVVSSRVGGIPEVINENNGRLIESENVAALSVAMIKLMNSYETYNQQQISDNAVGTYQYTQVGNAIIEVYKDVLSR